MGSVERNRNCVICGSVGAVCELEWVQGVWGDGVDVSHDQPFCECYGGGRYLYRLQYLAVLGHRDYSGLFILNVIRSSTQT
jgi:hypothetical protein